MFTVFVELESDEPARVKDYVDNRSANSCSRRKLLATSKRTVRLPFESTWISNFRKVSSLFFYATGMFRENKIIVVPAFRNYVESSEFPLRYATVQLLMERDNHKVEVDKAFLRSGRELTDFQIILKEWFFICWIAGTFFLFVLQFACILSIHLFVNSLFHRKPTVLGDDASNSLSLDGISEGVGDGSLNNERDYDTY